MAQGVGENSWDDSKPDPLEEDTGVNPADLEALLVELAGQHEVELPNKEKEENTDAQDFAVAEVDPDESKIFVPLTRDKEVKTAFRGEKFYWAQIIRGRDSKNDSADAEERIFAFCVGSRNDSWSLGILYCYIEEGPGRKRR